MRLSTLKSVREAPSPNAEQSQRERFHQVYIYEYLPSNTQFPIEKWVIGDYSLAQAREAYLLVGAFLSEQFSDPNDKGTPALTEQDVQAARHSVTRMLQRKSSS